MDDDKQFVWRVAVDNHFNVALVITDSEADDATVLFTTTLSDYDAIGIAKTIAVVALQAKLMREEKAARN